MSGVPRDSMHTWRGRIIHGEWRWWWLLLLCMVRRDSSVAYIFVVTYYNLAVSGRTGYIRDGDGRGVPPTDADLTWSQR